MERRSLSTLGVGESGTIVFVGGSGAMTIRLMEMGLVPGTPISLVKRAPLGDPLELRVRGYHLSLRSAEASAVEVEVT